VKKLKAKDIRGVWGSVLLPLNCDETIQWDSLARQVEHLCHSGLNGLYINGTACEFFAQSLKEYENLCEVTAAICEESNMPFQISASHMDYSVMLERFNIALKYDPSAIQIIFPDWIPMSNAEITNFLAHMTSIANGIGIVLYNPPHSKRVLNPQEMMNLIVPVKGLVGLKTGGGNDVWYSQMKDVFREISVFCPGHHMATAIKYGAHGSYSNVACISPKGAVHWYKLICGDMEKGLLLEADIQRFMATFIEPLMAKGYAGYTMDKLMATAGGWTEMSNLVRSPYLSPGEEAIAKVRDGIWEVLPEFMRLNGNTL